MFVKKQVMIIVVLGLIFVAILLSWNLFRDRQKPISVTGLDVTVQVQISGQEHASDSLLPIQFSWKTGPNWVSPGNHSYVFVHLQDEDGERICQDDHIPLLPFDSWQPNQEYSYLRYMYVPITLIKKKVVLLIGIYKKGETAEYFAFNGLNQFNRYHRYLAGEFMLVPSNLEYSEALIKYVRGWYDPELDSRGNVNWRWMKKSGECRLVNPKKDAWLYLDLWIPNQYFTNPAKVTIKLAGKPLEIDVTNRDYIQERLEIPADVLGQEDYTSLEFETDQTFIPAQTGDSVDVRELGLMVKKILFRAR
ncbi:hypothetical protein JXQ70_07040 [bacterium]|nr:hypothetical protein [bacterium]